MTRWLLPLLPWIPIPYRLLHGVLLEDNTVQNETDGWARLREPDELPRYRVIGDYLREFAHGGAVLDVGCADGILQERIAYGSYLGIDMFDASIARAQRKADARTRFLRGRGDLRPRGALRRHRLERVPVLSGAADRRDHALPPVPAAERRDDRVDVRPDLRHPPAVSPVAVLGEVRADTRVVAPDGLAWVLRAYDASLDRTAR